RRAFTIRRVAVVGTVRQAFFSSVRLPPAPAPVRGTGAVPGGGRLIVARPDLPGEPRAPAPTRCLGLRRVPRGDRVPPSGSVRRGDAIRATAGRRRAAPGGECSRRRSLRSSGRPGRPAWGQEPR